MERDVVSQKIPSTRSVVCPLGESQPVPFRLRRSFPLNLQSANATHRLRTSASLSICSNCGWNMIYLAICEQNPVAERQQNSNLLKCDHSQYQCVVVFSIRVSKLATPLLSEQPRCICLTFTSQEASTMLNWWPQRANSCNVTSHHLGQIIWFESNQSIRMSRDTTAWMILWRHIQFSETFWPLYI